MKKISKYSFFFFSAMLSMLIIFLFSCGKEKYSLNYEFGPESAAAIPYPDLRFAVISDIHIYDPQLGSTGAAFEATMNSDRKLLLDSEALLDYAIETIIASGVDFVLIPGDLTKDGEIINHRIVAEKLRAFSNAGIKVFVVPGNHDINNPDSVRYSGASTSPVDTVSADDFSRIYGDFGFNSAVMRDDDSLSYAAEPVPGLWLLGIDSCRYRENVPGKGEVVSGKISQRTADWIAMVLKTAAQQNKAVMLMQHHGVVEHWKGQSKLHPDYLILDYTNYSRFLASHNVRLSFTGHYHAQDIVHASFGDKYIYDIETGSLVTAPCPIRFLEIRNNTIHIRSEFIDEKLYPGTDFAVNARAFVKRTVMIEAAAVLKSYRVSDKDTEYIADAVGDAFSAHYSGDENPALRPDFDPKKLGPWGRFVYGQQKYALDGLWNDLPPADNNVSLELK